MTPRDRVTAVMPLQAESRTNSGHKSAAMSSLPSTESSRRPASSSPSSRSDRVHRARRIRIDPSRCDGCGRAEDHGGRYRRHRRRLFGADSARRVDASTPFWNGSTTVSGPMRGVSSRRRLGVVQLHGEQDDVHRPDRRGIVGPFTRGTCTSPFGLRIHRPRARRAPGAVRARETDVGARRRQPCAE